MAFALDEMSGVTDAELVRRLERLVTADRALCAKLLVHLGELEERRLYLERGFSSMYEYCRTALRMSDAEAYFRLKAAEVCERFPIVLERLAAGAVHLSGIKLLGPYLTAENHVKLLDRVRGMSKRQIVLLIAEIDPKPDAPARLRKLPTRREATESPLLAVLETSAATQPTTLAAPLAAAPAMVVSQSADAGASAASAAQAAFALQSPPVKGSTKPLSPGRFKLEVTLGQEAHDKLERLQDLLRHQNPSGDLASIVERALNVLLEREMKRRFAQTHAPKRVARKPVRSATNVNSPMQSAARDAACSGADAHAPTQSIARGSARSGPVADLSMQNVPGHSVCSEPIADLSMQREAQESVRSEPDAACSGTENGDQCQTGSAARRQSSRYIPRAVLREVYARDAGQCAFVSAEGRRCSARDFLEVDHSVVPFARGGGPIADNLQLACRAHNMFLAEQDYGREFMEEKLRAAGTR